MWVNLDGTEIEVYDFKKVYLDESDISKLIDEYKEEIVYQLVNKHVEEVVEELLKYGIVLNNREFDEIYLKYFGRLMNEIIAIKKYHEQKGKELEEDLVNVIQNFFEKRDAKKVMEMRNKIYDTQTQIRHAIMSYLLRNETP